MIELNLALVDLDIAQQRYVDAATKLDEIEGNRQFAKSSIFRPNIEYRRGTLDVLQYKIAEAKWHLESARALSEKGSQRLLVANSTFQLAKANQFGGDHQTALQLYEQAAKVYEALPDKYGLLRSYNNMAMIYFDDGNNDKARNFYNREQILGREVGDELAYARATVNISLVEKKEKNYDLSIRLALDALGVFKQQANLLGITTAAIVLANDYTALGNYPEAIAYSKQTLDIALQLRELRGVSTACGVMSNVYADTRDDAETLFASLCAATLIKHLKIDNLPNSGEDYGIFISRIKRIVAKNEDNRIMLMAAEKRVKEIFVKLNLDVDIVRHEVALATSQ